ncbi:MAG: RDD family protein [Planctomycetes bacterium]|nr:RDD family protein [Planctomycetota bacterium]
MSNYNPYTSPADGYNPMPTKGYPLADLGKRFLGALVDGLSGMVFVGPGYGLMIAGSIGQNEPGALVLVGMLLIGVGGLALLGVNLYLLFTRSQSIGKYLMKTQIVNFETGERADFVSCFLLRAFLNGLIGAIPCYGIVDIIFIFRPDRRCIHDLLAKTKVVDISTAA